MPNVDRILHLSPPEHPAFYSSARFTLNLTRQSMIAAGFSPSVRLFQASACGAAIISDAWKGLDHFLTPGREVLLPRDADDVVEILRNFPEDERRRIGLNARDAYWRSILRRSVPSSLRKYCNCAQVCRTRQAKVCIIRQRPR